VYRRQLAIFVVFSLAACGKSIGTSGSSQASATPLANKQVEADKNLLLIAKPAAKIPEQSLELILRAMDQDDYLSSPVVVRLGHTEGATAFEGGSRSVEVAAGGLVPPIYLHPAEETIPVIFEADGSRLGSMLLILVPTDDEYYDKAVLDHQEDIIASSDVHILLRPEAFPTDEGVATTIDMASPPPPSD
jgi:hypothetical protein